MNRRSNSTLIAVIILLMSNGLWGQRIHLKGQFWSGLTLGDDPADGYRSHSELLGYIPTLAWRRDLSGGAFFDIEWACKGWFTTEAPEGENFLHDGKQHRLWARLAGERFDLRLGLQRIAFGPGFVLRPLQWFDTLDPKDPTGQTDGVEALRVRYFHRDNLTLWLWAVRTVKPWQVTSNDNKYRYSPGLRIETTTPLGELGVAYHQEHSKYNLLDSETISDRRLGLDFRYDGFVGLWTELYYFWRNFAPYGDQQKQIMIGGDYTLPIRNGLYISVEHLLLPDMESSSSSIPQFTALIASLPLGMFDQIMAIVYRDWDNNRSLNYLRWARVYDNLSFNFMFALNPKRSAYENASLPVTLAGFGSSINFMMVYNH